MENMNSFETQINNESQERKKVNTFLEELPNYQKFIQQIEERFPKKGKVYIDVFLYTNDKRESTGEAGYKLIAKKSLFQKIDLLETEEETNYFKAMFHLYEGVAEMSVRPKRFNPRTSEEFTLEELAREFNVVAEDLKKRIEIGMIK